MSNSIRVVVHTQFRENYGAHTWDGKGECPQYWKSKGGDTYIISASADDIANPQWWVDMNQCIEHSSDYSAEYIIAEKVVDVIDFVESNYHEEWESPIRATVAGGKMKCSKDSLDFITNKPVGVRTWIQSAQGLQDITLNEHEEVA